MPKVDFHRRMLEQALRISGSREALSRRLLVPVEALEEWLQGKDRIPKPIFLILVDIVLEGHPVEPQRGEPQGAALGDEPKLE